jgi:hypothetical protein
MSNCKPGELATVVRPVYGSGDSDCYRGAIVQVQVPIFTEAGLIWEVAEPVRCVRSANGVCTRNMFRDSCLQPLRGDEGDHRGDVKVKSVAADGRGPFSPYRPEKQIDRSGRVKT